MSKRSLETRILVGAVFILLTASLVPLTAGVENSSAELEITAIRGGFGKVCIEIKNVGDEVAEQVVSTISVKGGIFNRIDVFKLCSGCGQCNNSIPPDGFKEECTDQFIFGFGSVDIVATVNATGVSTVEKTASAFVIGPLVIVL